MSEKNYDENFLRNEVAADDSADWYEVTFESFDIYGLIPDEDEGILTRRIPKDVAKKVNGGVFGMSGHGAGGRIVFATDSPFIAFKAEYTDGWIPTVCNHCLTYGFDLYRFTEDEQDVFVGACRPVDGFDRHYGEYKINTSRGDLMTCYTINTPHFTGVKKLYIGIEKGRTLQKQKKYRNDKPVVFYGSSITHGAAAGRPGNTYENFISQKYNLDYVNLGFSGSAKGEQTMVDYLAGLDMCLFVSDYDHNAPTKEHLEATHYPLYEAIRKTHPDIPYIMVTKPDFFTNPTDNGNRRSVVFESYKRAVAAGDKNVYFIDGATLFEGEFATSCTSDGCHPNDLGFYRMAQKIGKVIAEALGIE